MGRVRLLDFPKNRGKVATLNDAVPRLTGEIVAFSDASSMLAPESLRHLAQYFADPQVGAVSGVYRVLKKDRARLGVQEDFYWKYETFLKVQETKLGGFTGAHGSLYAIRRGLYPFPAANTINDEVLDVVAEMTNMMIGNVKNGLEAATGPLAISVPTVIHGRNFHFRNTSGLQGVALAFTAEGENFEVRIALAPVAQQAASRSRIPILGLAHV